MKDQRITCPYTAGSAQSIWVEGARAVMDALEKEITIERLRPNEDTDSMSSAGYGPRK